MRSKTRHAPAVDQQPASLGQIKLAHIAHIAVWVLIMDDILSLINLAQRFANITGVAHCVCGDSKKLYVDQFHPGMTGVFEVITPCSLI